MSAFADAIAKSLDPLHEGEPPWTPEGCAIVVLTSPEMQAIKAHLRKDAEQMAETDWKDGPADILLGWGLPQTVVDWVLS